MSALDFLERLASETSSAHGMAIGDARKLVRLAMITVAVKVGVPADQVVAYVESVGLPAKAVTT